MQVYYFMKLVYQAVWFIGCTLKSRQQTVSTSKSIEVTADDSFKVALQRDGYHCSPQRKQWLSLQSMILLSVMRMQHWENNSSRGLDINKERMALVDKDFFKKPLRDNKELMRE